MRLTLTLSRTDLRVEPSTRILDEGAVAIGRGGQADWVLADDERVLSKVHLRIDATPAGWTVTDTSTNGVWLNEDDRPIGNGHTTSLRDGDRMIFGPYELLAALTPIPVVIEDAPDPFLALLDSEPVVEAPRFPLGDGIELAQTPFPDETASDADDASVIPEDWYVAEGADAPRDRWAEAPSSTRFVDGNDLAALASELLRALAAIAAAQDTLEAVERDRIDVDPAAVAARLRAAPSDPDALRDATALIRAHQEALLEALQIGQQSLPRTNAASFADLCGRAYIASLSAQLRPRERDEGNIFS